MHLLTTFLMALLGGCGGVVLVDRFPVALDKSDTVMVTRTVRRAMEFPVPHSAWFSVGRSEGPSWAWKWQGRDHKLIVDDMPMILNHDSQDFYAVMFVGQAFRAQRFREGRWQDVLPVEFPADIARFNVWQRRPSEDPWSPWLTVTDGNQRAFLHWLRDAQPNLPSDSDFCMQRLKERWNLLCPQEEDALVRREGWEHVPTTMYRLPDDSERRLFESLGLTSACRTAESIKGPSDACRVMERMRWRGDSLVLIEAGYPTDVLLVHIEPQGPRVLQRIVKHSVEAPCRLQASPHPDSSRLVLSLFDSRSEGVSVRWELLAPLRPLP